MDRLHKEKFKKQTVFFWFIMFFAVPTSGFSQSPACRQLEAEGVSVELQFREVANNFPIGVTGALEAIKKMGGPGISDGWVKRTIGQSFVIAGAFRTGCSFDFFTNLSCEQGWRMFGMVMDRYSVFEELYGRNRCNFLRN